MSKITLIVISLIVVIMGFLALPNIGMATEPLWHAWLKIIVGVIGLVVGFLDKGKKTA